MTERERGGERSLPLLPVSLMSYFCTYLGPGSLVVHMKDERVLTPRLSIDMKVERVSEFSRSNSFTSGN